MVKHKKLIWGLLMITLAVTSCSKGNDDVTESGLRYVHEFCRLLWLPLDGDYEKDCSRCECGENNIRHARRWSFAC